MNEHRRNIKITAMLATLLGIMGFYLDGNLKDEGFFINTLEILTMTSILFVLFSSVYFMINYLFNFDRSSSSSSNDIGN